MEPSEPPSDQNLGISVTAEDFRVAFSGPRLSAKAEDLILNTCVSLGVQFSSIRVRLTSPNHPLLFYSEIFCRRAQMNYYSFKICDYAP